MLTKERHFRTFSSPFLPNKPVSSVPNHWTLSLNSAMHRSNATKRMIESPNACDRVEVEKPCHKPRSSKLVFIDKNFCLQNSPFSLVVRYS